MQDYQKVKLYPQEYEPTSRRAGAGDPTLLRIRNMLMTGEDTQIGLQCYKGSLDLSENIATQDLTGTLTAGQGAVAITGAGTAFLSELRSGQFFYAGNDLCVVNAITDDTHLTIYRALTTALVGATGKRLPVIFEIDRRRGTLIQGNAHRFDKGNIIGTGTGTLKINGAVLPGTSMVLTGSPKIAYWDPTGHTYTVVSTLGFPTPTTAPVLTSVAGGTHGMIAGSLLSLRMVPGNTSTNGFGNPGPRTNITIVNNGDKIKVDVTGGPAMDGPSNQTNWDMYGSLTTGSPNQGDWFFIRSVTAAEIAGGPNFFYIDYLDYEINRQGNLDYDNDAPPAAAFLAVLEGFPVYISCNGPTNGSPGPSIQPGKFDNVEAAPAIWNVRSSPPQDLLGYTQSLARLYFLTNATLQQAVYNPTGNPTIPPISMRPYWHVGFANPYQAIFVNGMIVGAPHSGPTRSIADAEKAEEQFFGAKVAEIWNTWTGQHVLVEEDPDPAVNAICFFHPADSKNQAGFWRTRVLIWGLRQNAWIGDVMLESQTEDRIVCGVARVDNVLYFLAGGKNQGGSIFVKTFQWNTADGSSVAYSACWQLSNGGFQDQDKQIRGIYVAGKLTSGHALIYGYNAGVNIDISAIENSTGFLLNVSLGTQTLSQRLLRHPAVTGNVALFTTAVTGTYAGSGDPDRVDEVVMDYVPIGPRG